MSSPPSPPSPATISAEQQTANQQNMQMTQAASGQSNPFGSLTPTYNPATGQYTMQQQYTPVEQSMLGNTQATQLQAGANAPSMLASGNYGAGMPDLTNLASGPTASLMNDFTQSIAPQSEYLLGNESTQLQNMGLGVGSAAYNQGMEPINQGIESALAGAQTQFEPMAFNQALTQFQEPLSIGSALAGLGSPVPLSSTFSGYGAPQGQQATNIGQVVGQQQQAQANAFGGLVSGVGAGLGALTQGGTGGFANSMLGSGLGALMLV